MRPTKEHFASAATEVARDQIDAGLWAMATADALGNKDSTYATYLRLRAEELSKDERNEATRRISDATKDRFERAISHFWNLLALWFYFYMAFVVLIVFGGVVIEMLGGADEPGKETGRLVGEYILIIAGASVVVAGLYKIYRKRA